MNQVGIESKPAFLWKEPNLSLNSSRNIWECTECIRMVSIPLMKQRREFSKVNPVHSFVHPPTNKFLCVHKPAGTVVRGLSFIAARFSNRRQAVKSARASTKTEPGSPKVVLQWWERKTETVVRCKEIRADGTKSGFKMMHSIIMQQLWICLSDLNDLFSRQNANVLMCHSHTLQDHAVWCTDGL